MSTTLKLLTLPLLVLFLFAQFAEAALTRTSGRGDLSLNFSEAFYYVDNQYLNEAGIIESAFDVDFFGSPKADNSILRIIGGGGRGLGAVPNDCIKGYDQSHVDDLEQDIDYWRTELSYDRITEAQFDAEVAALELAVYGEPCVWEFAQGDALSMFGFFSLYFDTPNVLYDVNWLINGLSLAGEINTTGDVLTPDGIINKGWVTLNTPPLSILVPGDYLVSVSVGLSASMGKFFWTSSEPGNLVEFRERCITKENPSFDPEDDDSQEFIDVCGYDSVSRSTDLVVDARTMFYSDQEILRILPATTGPDITPVNAPASIALLLFGLVALVIRRQRVVAN